MISDYFVNGLSIARPQVKRLTDIRPLTVLLSVTLLKETETQRLKKIL